EPHQESPLAAAVSIRRPRLGPLAVVLEPASTDPELELRQTRGRVGAREGVPPIYITRTTGMYSMMNPSIRATALVLFSAGTALGQTRATAAPDGSGQAGGGEHRTPQPPNPTPPSQRSRPSAQPPGPGPCPRRNRNQPGSLLLFPEYDNTAAALTLATITDAVCDGSGPPMLVEVVYIPQGSCLETNATFTLTPCDSVTFLTSTHVMISSRGFF